MLTSCFPADSLLEGRRSTRPPLREWAAALVGSLARAVDDDATSWTDISTWMNNAALIEVFRGDLAGARETCELQLRWLARLADVHGCSAVAELALQPWINLGRLERIEGRHHASLPYFALLLDVRGDRALELGPVVLDAASRRLLRERALAFLQTIYVLDSAKSLFATGSADAVLEFLRAARANLEASEVHADEVEIIALARTGRIAEAERVLERSAWPREGYSGLVRLVYRVALLALQGAVPVARIAAARLAERLLAQDPEAAHREQFIRCVQRLGNIAQHVGEHEAAARLCGAGLDTARKLGDVPLELALVESLLQNPVRTDHVELEAQRAAILERCLYVTLLRPRGLTLTAGANAPTEFAALRVSIRQMAAAARSNELRVSRPL